jgi:hypothetical protein
MRAKQKLKLISATVFAPCTTITDKPKVSVVQEMLQIGSFSIQVVSMKTTIKFAFGSHYVVMLKQCQQISLVVHHCLLLCGIAT